MNTQAVNETGARTAERVSSDVHVLFANDGILGIFLNLKQAREAALAFRESKLDLGAWTELVENSRWCQDEGPYARLEIQGWSIK